MTILSLERISFKRARSLRAILSQITPPSFCLLFSTNSLKQKMSKAFKIPRSKYSFEVLPGYFVYTNPAVPNESLPAYAPRFGLEKGKTWKEVKEDLIKLNAQANHTRQSYKLVFAARHGEGVHNVAEAKYGTKEWDANWSLLKGDGENVWGPDPPLTKVGEQQAIDANEKWQKELRDVQDPVPLPTLFFSSPMIRSARTLQLTFDGIVWPAAANGDSAASLIAPLETRPHILECLREDFKDRHTCDERSKKSTILASWNPFKWSIDATMDEEDTIFAVSNNIILCMLPFRLLTLLNEKQSEYKESREVMTQRLEDALSFVWQLADGHDVINITSHSGAMEALFRAVKHDDFKPKTGGECDDHKKGTFSI